MPKKKAPEFIMYVLTKMDMHTGMDGRMKKVPCGVKIAQVVHCLS